MNYRYQLIVKTEVLLLICYRKRPLDSITIQNWWQNMVFRKTSKLNNTVGMKKTRRKNRYKHTKRNTRIYVVRPLAYVHGLQQEKISLTNIENTKWCGSILTKPNPITPKIILSYKYKLSLSLNTKHRADYKVQDCN